jgi:hypothetical protein
MHVTYMKLAHIYGYVAYACALKQFVFAPCVNMANVSTHDNKAYATYKTYHVLILHRVIQ